MGDLWARIGDAVAGGLPHVCNGIVEIGTGRAQNGFGMTHRRMDGWAISNEGG